MPICARMLSLSTLTATVLMLSGCGMAGEADVDTANQSAEESAKQAEEAKIKADKSANKVTNLPQRWSADVPIDNPPPPQPMRGPERPAADPEALANNPDYVGNN